jgi:hypothetical protein
MGEATLSRSVTLLKFQFVNQEQAVFADYDWESRSHVFHLDSNVWADMGHPKEITVAIWPGDALNDENHPAHAQF